MKVAVDYSAISKTHWSEHAIRFVFGGAVTALTGVFAKEYGPVAGGLFLAFPAIFPASTTLIEKHERKKKQSAGIVETVRGTQAAAVEARGTAMGSIGLAAFGVVVSLLLPGWNTIAALTAALLAWTVVSILIWRISRSHLFWFYRKSDHH